MKRFYLLFLIILTVLTTTGCRVFDWFSKDSTSQQGSSSYTPPVVPETLEQEQPAVKGRLSELTRALESKNIEKAVELCVDQDGYQQAFQKAPDKMPVLGEAIKSARLRMVGPYNRNGVRIGELALEVASKTFTISIVKIGGKWFFQDL